MTEIEELVVKIKPEEFEQEIVKSVSRNSISYLEAVSDYMEKNDLDPEYISKLITPNLLSKLERNAKDLNLIEKSEELDV